MRPPSHFLCVWYWHCTIPGRQPPLYTHICELRNFARLKISTFRLVSSSQAGQVSPSLLWVSCKLTPSDLSQVYHVSHSVWYLQTVYISEETWSADSISALVLDCTISRHQASLSCLCQGARHILLINCDLTLLWLHIISRHLGTGHGYHGASHIMLAAGPRYILYCRHTLSTRDKQMKTSY